ncbi:MAG: AMP-binding protein [Pararhodobacter sp.]|nr:AMP-binding protein [Pararhodobacter sp.]
MNLAWPLAQTARRFPQRAGLIWRETVLSWHEIDSKVSALAAALSALGLGPGERLMIHSPNCPEMVLTMFACFRLGAVWVPTNFRCAPDEIGHVVATSGARVLVCHSDFPAHAAAARAALPEGAPVLSIGEAGFADTTVQAAIAAHDGIAVGHAPVTPDDPAWFFFTSGTTGKPKGAVLTCGTLAFNITAQLADMMPGLDETHASLVVAPLSHGAGAHLLPQVARGAVSVLMPDARFDAAEAIRLIEAHRITNLFTVPTIVKMLVEHPALARHDHSSLRHLVYAGAPMYQVDQQRAHERLGEVLVQYYGLAEATGTVTVLTPRQHRLVMADANKAGTCGVARSGTCVSLRGRDGSEVPVGEVGEVCVAGPAVFAGYHGDAAASAEALRDGWLLTGDLGRFDAEGFLYLTGRVSEMYISGGSNIYPREIEEKLLEHPGIVEIAVLGVPDPDWGEVGAAFYVCRPDAQTDPETLASYAATRLARYKLPRHWTPVEELPKSAYGKVLKRVLKQQFLTG